MKFARWVFLIAGIYGLILGAPLYFSRSPVKPRRYRPMMLPSNLEKISNGMALSVLHQQQRVPESIFRMGMADWIFAVLFTVSFV